MSPRLLISSHVIQRLKHFDSEENTGCLYGIMYDGSLLVLGLSIELFENENAYKQLLLSLPTEMELCGAIKFGGSLNVESRMKEILQHVDCTDNPLVILLSEEKEIKAHFLVHDKLETTTFEEMAEDTLWREFLLMRLTTVVPFSCEATTVGVKNFLQSKRKKIASGQVSFNIVGSTVYLFGVASDVGVTGIDADACLGDLVNSMNPGQNKKKHSNNPVEIVPVNLVMKATRDILSDKLVKTAVKMMTTQRKPAFYISMPLKLDSLAMIHRNTKLVEIYNILVEAVCRCLRLLEFVLLEQLGQEGIGDGAGLRLPETFHYLPQELGHFITRIVPKGIPDETMEKERRNLHEQLALTKDRPIFRRGNAYSASTAGGKLINPHVAIPQQVRKPEMVVALVRGRYAYHHYMQDNFNDDGWGCAYRSLQTIFSWFRLQGYTTADIPTHKEIQQCLVKIGDKPTAFVGSKQWIGSTEVMFCIETLLGVQSRIIFANTGPELQGYVPEIVHHFQRHGTPIMIGGGVLAHTIIGIEYNKDNNETRYLILDPHYTGGEDVTTIINKGWCGWKNAEFWNKTAHYNLCLPQIKPAI